MAYVFVTMEELKQKIVDEEEVHEGHMTMLDALQQALIKGDSVLHEKETDKWFIVPKGQPVPFHLQDLILGR